MTRSLISRGSWVALLLTIALAAQAASDYTTPYAFTTLAGFSSIGSNDGPGSIARFYAPRGIALDRNGNAYVADAVNNTIRKITPTGIVSTLAGTAGIFGAGMAPSTRPPLDGTGPDAIFSNPEGIAVDQNGIIYVTDKMAFLVRRITPGGVVTTLAGAMSQPGSADGTGSEARFHVSSAATTDSAGNIYTTDWYNNTIRKITPEGVVTTLAGLAGTSGSADGKGDQARFFQPMGIVADANGVLYVADAVNCTIRKIAPDGTVTTIAGLASTAGDADGSADNARFRYPHGITIDGAGNLYIADSGNSTIRKLTPGGTVTTIAGLAGERGSADGNGTAARFQTPAALAIDAQNVLYVADEYDNTIRKISPSGDVSTWAGLGRDNSVGSADGNTTSALFNNLAGTAIGPSGDIYVADTVNSTIRKISVNGTVTTLAGKAGVTGSTDGTGDAARFASPYGVAVDTSGMVYVSDPGNDNIRKITPTGVVTTLAGDASAPPGSTNGTGADALFNYPCGLALDAAGNLLVADRDNSIIRRIQPNGAVDVFAGKAGTTGSDDGSAANARFNHPTAVAADRSGNAYVADTANHTIRKISPSGAVTTLAGSPLTSGSTDSTGASALFNSPDAIAVDMEGNVYVADTGNHVIRKVTPAGMVTTLGGLALAGGYADGAGEKSRFSSPSGVAVDTQGMVYVTSGTTVRKGQLATVPVITTQPATQNVTTGSTVQFIVAASGAPSPSYQWYRNGELLSSATTDTLSLPNVQSSDAADYTVVVSNELGSVTSNKATLTVTAATPPPSSGGSSGSTAGGSGGGGGGAPSPWFLVALMAMAAARRRATRRTA